MKHDQTLLFANHHTLAETSDDNRLLVPSYSECSRRRQTWPIAWFHKSMCARISGCFFHTHTSNLSLPCQGFTLSLRSGAVPGSACEGSMKCFGVLFMSCSDRLSPVSYKILQILHMQICVLHVVSSCMLVQQGCLSLYWLSKCARRGKPRPLGVEWRHVPQGLA